MGGETKTPLISCSERETSERYVIAGDKVVPYLFIGIGERETRMAPLPGSMDETVVWTMDETIVGTMVNLSGNADYRKDGEGGG